MKNCIFQKVAKLIKFCKNCMKFNKNYWIFIKFSCFFHFFCLFLTFSFFSFLFLGDIEGDGEGQYPKWGEDSWFAAHGMRAYAGYNKKRKERKLKKSEKNMKI